jgi:hypothetical protein
MPYPVHLLFHFFIILFSETSLPLSSFSLSSVLLCGCQSHGNHFLPPNQPQNKNTHTHTKTNKQTKSKKHKQKNIITKIKKQKNTQSQT